MKVSGLTKSTTRNLFGVFISAIGNEAVVSRVVFWTDVFKAKRTNRCNLRDVFTRFRPVEMGCIARQNDNASGRIRLEFIGIELITQTDIENAGDNCVDPIFRVSVWHDLHEVGHANPDRVWADFRGTTDDYCQADRRWKSWEGLPLEVFGQDRSKNVLARLVRSNYIFLCIHSSFFFLV